MLLVFFETEAGGAPADPDELAFDVDVAGFEAAYKRARGLSAVTREPVDHTRWSRGFLCVDPDGRRIEIVYDDRSVYWR